MGQKSTFFAISSKCHIRFWGNVAKSCGIWFAIIWNSAVCLEYTELIHLIPWRTTGWRKLKVFELISSKRFIEFCWFLPALCRKTYAFRVVSACVCVCHTISGKPHIRFFLNFAQSCILIKLKKCSKRIFEKNS